MSILNNPHIMRYYGCWEQEGRLHIQMELCENNLSNIAKSRRIQNSEFSEQELRDILSQMSLALMHMHSVPICHMDIKPENIYLHDGFYKLGDLGQSLYYLKGDESYDIKDGDGRYLCKEVLEFDYAHLQQADIFALGASIYELALGTDLPSTGAQFHRIRDGELEPLPVSEDMMELIRLMMHPDPDKRPSPAQILAHPALRQTTEEKLVTAEARIRDLEEKLREQSALEDILQRKIEFLEKRLGHSDAGGGVVQTSF